MKKLLLLLFTLSSLLLSTEFEQITAEKKNFLVITESYKEYTSTGKAMRLYIEEPNHNLTLLFSLTLADATGVCSDKKIQKGTYDLNSTHVTLYNFWDRIGDTYSAPYGARIQHYKILDNNTLDLLYAKIYIESEAKNYALESGMQYLFDAPKTDTEQALFEEYITDMERQYKGAFVFADNATKLMIDVRHALNKKSQSRWK